MGEQVLDQARRESQRAGQWLAEATAVQRADQRGQDQIRDRAVIAVASVGGDHEVGLVLNQGTGQAGEPLVGDRDDVGLQHDDRPGPQSLRFLTGQPESGAPPGHAVKGHDGTLGDGRVVVEEHDRKAGGGDEIGCAVGGARVDVHQGGRHSGEVMLEAGSHRCGHGRGRGGVVVGQEADRQVRGGGGRAAGGGRGGAVRAGARPQRSEVGPGLGHVTGSGVGHPVRWISSARWSVSWRVTRKERRTCSRPAAPMRAISSGLLSRCRMRKAAPSTEWTV